MAKYLPLEKYSIGVGDRFAQQGQAQLRACLLAVQQGITVIPVWNKSNREHLIIGSEPAGTRAAADAAVRALGWSRPHHVDADHIRLETVDRFLPHADFFTFDVADSIGKPVEARAIELFIERHSELVGRIQIPGIERPFESSRGQLAAMARKYLLATREAGRLYRHVASEKGETAFITEVSMDETDTPQTPQELLLILAALADEGIPLQSIAPKFTGRFNKGVDYVGDLAQFEREFGADLAVVAWSIKQYRLPASLKLSVHSGSDKFSLYAPMRRLLTQFNSGLHLKTAGTTWLEELIGLAEADGTGLEMAKEIYAAALGQIDSLCAPYAAVIDIDRNKLPSAEAVSRWTSDQYVSALRHDQKNRAYNPHVRQLLHVGYKIAARMGTRYLETLTTHEAAVARNVTENLYERHLKPLFLPGLRP
jgi:hypothetical protein